MRPDGPRPTIIGPDSGPEAPFPLRMKGKVVSGFGRGSKELGIPTANIPVDNVPWISTIESGAYFGWAGIQLPPSHPDLSPTPQSNTHAQSHIPTGAPTPYPSEPSSPSSPTQFHTQNSPLPPSKATQGWRLYPMVMSIGYNPFYKNTVRSAEVHVLHKFGQDFYGSEMAVSILGFIRPEYDYVDVEALIGDIKMDCEVAGRSLGREGWGIGGKWREDGWLWGGEE